MGVYIKNITKDDLAENGALMWGKRIIFIPPEDIIPVQDHGDLIDRDKLILGLEMLDHSYAPDTLEEWEIADLKPAPVVIPAERREE